MNQKAITYWLKAVTVAFGLLGLAFFGGATAYAFFYKPDYNEPVPEYLRNNIAALWITAVICYIILFFFWLKSKSYPHLISQKLLHSVTMIG